MTKQNKNALIFWSTLSVIVGSVYLGRKLFSKKDSNLESKSLKRVKVKNVRENRKNSNIESSFYDTQDSVNIESDFKNFQDSNNFFESKNEGIYLDSQNIESNFNDYKDFVILTSTKKSQHKRPSFKSMQSAYKTINEVGRDNPQYDKCDDYIKAHFRYSFLGGKIYNLFANEPSSYVNTCAVQISYALNNSGISIKKILESSKDSKLILIKNNIQRFGRIDKDGDYYITSSADIETFLGTIWGGANFVRKQMTTKEENEKALKDLKEKNKSGIVTMKIDFADRAKGHTTLWNLDEFVDNSNYLATSTWNQCIDSVKYNLVVKELHF